MQVTVRYISGFRATKLKIHILWEKMCVFINCIDSMKVGGDIICNCQYLEGKLHCKRHVIQVSKNSCLKKLKYFREVGGDLICTCHCVWMEYMWCNCCEKYWRDISKSRRKPDLYLSTDGMYHGFLSASPQLMLRHTDLSNAPWALLHHNPSVVGGRGGDIGG